MDGDDMRRLPPDRQGDQVRATPNLVAPLSQVNWFTEKRIEEIAGLGLGGSGAVATLIGESLRRGDVDSANIRSTPITPATLGTRTSTTATRTTGTRTTSSGRVPSADYDSVSSADLSFGELVQAYFDCRRRKRNTRSALAFEMDLERNLAGLFEDLISGNYSPGRSICFPITHPKLREVWAADFRDRIVQHLLYNRIAPRFHAAFIADTCACIPGRGTLYAAKRLEHHVRSITQNWTRPAYYLKCDVANFFTSIDKRIVRDEIAKRVHEPFWMRLAETILFHDPRTNYELRGSERLLAQIPAHKSLFGQSAWFGLPIGNLPSQFDANVLLDGLDQYVVHKLKLRYVRYVDDFVSLHQSAQILNMAKARMEEKLATLGLRLNPKKTILQPIDRGIDFCGQVILPHRRVVRRRTVNAAVKRLATLPAGDLHATANSYLGTCRQASKSWNDRRKLARVALRRGRTVDLKLTKTYRPSEVKT
jgi:RNA-directed DNA polymerase